MKALINKRVFAIVLALYFSTGCATQPPEKQVNESDVIRPLQESTLAIAESLRVLRELQNSKYVSQLSEQEIQEAYDRSRNLPESLNIPITINHHGDAEKLIRMIGRLTRFKVADPVGRIPHDKPIVRINARGRPAADIIRDIGTQAGDRLHIRVIPSPNPNEHYRGVIELEYTR